VPTGMACIRPRGRALSKLLHGVPRGMLRKCERASLRCQPMADRRYRIATFRSHPTGAITTRTVGRLASATGSTTVR
jgi:hypothetical protein